MGRSILRVADKSTTLFGLAKKEVEVDEHKDQDQIPNRVMVRYDMEDHKKLKAEEVVVYVADESNTEEDITFCEK